MHTRKSSSGTNHRRSSILKPAKTRQPFQDLDFNNSSPDISPESIKKRRVSFAEKKHVKEFCDHKEQGTIWDSTYEEADQNVSKSTELSSENCEAIGANLDNVETEMREAGFGFLLQSSSAEPSVNMSSNCAGNFFTKHNNLETENDDLELTDIIACSQVTRDDPIQRTIICQDGNLDMTEAIGGIEQTVSLKNLIHLRAREPASSTLVEDSVAFKENTILFDNTEGEINFTEVVSAARNRKSIPSKNVDDSLIENRTIIFEDSVMELTLTESPSSKPNKDERTVGEREVQRASNNKTLFFSDYGCEMTEAINTKIPPIELEKENLGARGRNNQIPRIPDPNGDKTIFFDDYRCEMTEAINFVRNCPEDDENSEETKNIEQVVPYEARNVISSDIPSSPRENIDDSAMEFTVAITRSRKSAPNERRRDSSYEILDEAENKEDEEKSLDNSAMEFTVAIQSRNNIGNGVEKQNFTPRKSRTVIYEDCDIDVTESVAVAPCILNPASNSEEENCSSSTRHRESDSHKITPEKLFSDSKISNIPELHSTQSLVGDESVQETNENPSNQFVSNCKGLKVEDNGTRAESSGPEVDSVAPESEESRNIPSGETFVETVSDSLEIQNAESTKSVEALASEKNSTFHDPGELEDRESDNDAEDERSFVDELLENLDENSKSEILEFSRIYEKQRRSITSENKSVESSLEPGKKSIDYNEDCCFAMFTEDLEKRAKSVDCIWDIRSNDTKEVAINFISKSLVVFIRLEDTQELTTFRIIKEIKIVSLLPDDANENISMVHRILLKKLEPEKLRRRHRTTQDILPLLELISDKVKLAMDFMYEFDKLQDLHLINREENRISFRLFSYKVTMVIKITIDIEPLEDVGTNDVRVECILGNVREKDIQELIIGVKKDHKFLTNYIKDIKEYIALVVEK